MQVGGLVHYQRLPIHTRNRVGRPGTGDARETQHRYNGDKDHYRSIPLFSFRLIPYTALEGTDRSYRRFAGSANCFIWSQGIEGCGRPRFRKICFIVRLACMSVVSGPGAPAIFMPGKNR